MEDQEELHAEKVEEVTEATESLELSEEDLEDIAGGRGKVRSAIARGSIDASNLRKLRDERVPTN